MIYFLTLVLFRVENTNLITALALYKAHTRDIWSTVSNIDDILIWSNKGRLRHTIVYSLIVLFKDSFGNPEYELSLIGIVYGLCWPFGNTIRRIQVRRCIDAAEILGDITSFNNLLQPGRYDVMMNFNTIFLTVLIHPFKPRIHSIV